MVGNTHKYTTATKHSSSLSATSTNTTTSSSLLPPPQTQNMPYYLRRHKELTSNNSSTLSLLNVNNLLLMPNSNTSTTTTQTNTSGKHLSKIPQYCSSQSSAASSPSPSPSSSSSSCSLQNELIHHHLQQMKSTNNNKNNNKKVTTTTATTASKAAMVQLSFETNNVNKKHAQLNETSFNNKKLMKKKRTSTVTNVNVNAIIKKSNNSSYLMSCTTSRSGSSSSNASTSHSNQETSSDCDEDDDDEDDDDDDNNNNEEKAEENTITTTLLDDGADEINDDMNNNNADVNNKNKAVTFSDKITISKCSGTRGGQQQQNTTNIAKLNGKASRTPPHKKFRKLRLFDTPHTPKTLIKKSKLAAALNPISDESKSNSTDEATSKIELPPPPPPLPPSSSSSLKPSSLPVSILRPVSTPVNIFVANEEKKSFIDTSPPHNQLFKTSKLFNDIFENVHHTPKSLRRTPNLAFKLPHDSNVQEMMDVDVCCFQSAKKVSATKTQQQSQHLRQKLFDQNEEQAQSSCSLKMCETTTTTTMANKILNFDDTDNEEEYLKVTASHKMSSSECIDDEMRSLFEPVSSSTNLNKMSKKNARTAVNAKSIVVAICTASK